VIPRHGQANDLQDHAKREDPLGGGDCAKDGTLGIAFGKANPGQAEAGSANDGEQEADDRSQKPDAALEERDPLEELLAVLVEGLERDDRAGTSGFPGCPGRARDSELADVCDVAGSRLASRRRRLRT
jgi:hypothetical protein